MKELNKWKNRCLWLENFSIAKLSILPRVSTVNAVSIKIPPGFIWWCYKKIFHRLFTNWVGFYSANHELVGSNIAHRKEFWRAVQGQRFFWTKVNKNKAVILGIWWSTKAELLSFCEAKGSLGAGSGHLCWEDKC